MEENLYYPAKEYVEVIENIEKTWIPIKIAKIYMDLVKVENKIPEKNIMPKTKSML